MNSQHTADDSALREAVAFNCT